MGWLDSTAVSGQTDGQRGKGSQEGDVHDRQMDTNGAGTGQTDRSQGYDRQRGYGEHTGPLLEPLPLHLQNTPPQRFRQAEEGGGAKAIGEGRHGAKEGEEPKGKGQGPGGVDYFVFKGLTLLVLLFLRSGPPRFSTVRG